MEMIFGIVLLFIFFISIEKLFPAQLQKTFRTGWRIDVTHFVVNYFAVQLGVILAILPVYLLSYFFSWAIPPGVQAVITRQPGWLQFLEAFLIAEISSYIIHRLVHTIPWLWQFHSIHHCSPDLDWLSALRFHPIDLVLERLFIVVPLFLLGFSKEVLEVYALTRTFQSLFIHTNINFDFPILRWLIATPESHRWHHDEAPETQNKNFGQPFIDFLFGTLYLPNDKKPAVYGVHGLMLDSYKEQLMYPFQKQKQISLIESTSQRSEFLESSKPESPIHR
jgi:sterol desaturase/sphingolipid hydroxylase (fatty acid hydroxylase superfamily)